MTWAHLTTVTPGAAADVARSVPPDRPARRLDNGDTVAASLRTLAEDGHTGLLAACGWHPVTDTPRPADTATTTHDRTVQVTAVDPVTVTVVWTERPKTPGEVEAETVEARRERIPIRVRDGWADLAGIARADEDVFRLLAPLQQAVRLFRSMKVLARAVMLLARRDPDLRDLLAGDTSTDLDQ